MPVEAQNGLTPKYACECLNVQIKPSPPPHPQGPAEQDYTSVYVGDDGIVVAHTQLTLRIRSRAKQHTKGDTTDLTRYTSLMCLICRTTVYRVFQVISPDVDSAEGPVTPSDEWAERELLKSLSGWIEVHKDCITGDAVAQLETSPLISKLFGIVLPSETPLALIVTPQYSTPSSSPTTSMTPTHHLPALQPLYLPPPFTPTHPVFRHMSAIANDRSSQLRDEAEAYLKKVVQEKVEELEAAELKLKQEVELLWISYKQNISEAAPTVNGHRGNPGFVKTHHSTGSRSGTVSLKPGSVNGGTSASVRIHEFVPSPSLPRRSSGVVSPIQTSALSSSLATTSFQHPRVLSESRTRTPNGSSPPPYSPNPPSPGRSSTTGARSLATASSRTLTTAVDGAGSVLDAHRRNMDERIDFATSYKYQSVLEAEMAAQAREQTVERAVTVSPPAEQPTASGSGFVVPRGRSPKMGKSAIKKPKSNGSTSPSTKRSTSSEADPKETPTKGKRKVTFDVKPDVAIINSNGPVHKIDESKPEQEAVFDMESERDDLDADELTSPPISLPTTPKAEPVRAPIRRTRPANMAGLPSSLSALRPESLPAPTSIRPFLPHESSQTEDRPRSEIVRESLLLADSKARVIEEYHELLDMAQETSDPREAEILKLVAASTPSHRSAWKKDSKAWQVFVSRHEQKIKSAHNAIAEEEEDSTAESNTSRGGYYDESEDDASGLEDDYNLTSNEPIAHSLPIAIAPLSEHKLKFGVPSYQPKTSLSDRPGVLVPPLRKTQSEALKRASYAERDRARSIDPGTLDFTAEEEEKDDPEEEDVVENVEVGGRGRQHALKILEARSEVPGEGMWRSLA